MAIPVAASGGTTLSLNVQGYEIFAGIVNGGYRYGATFIAQVSGDYNGVLTVSTNYHVAAPVPGGENDIIGGSWTLTLVQNGKTVGTIVGKISGGSVEWYPRVSVLPPVVAGTDYGVVTAPITFMGISKTFAGKSGGGTFTGEDNHASNVYLFGIEVPVVTGTISLNFTN